MKATALDGTTMTDKEFWSVMAETVAQAKTMPDFVPKHPVGAFPNLEHCYGLCSLVISAERTGLIEKSQYGRLFDQIDSIPISTRRRKCSPFYWREGDWRPRVKAMRKLAKQAA
jgi:hypothetical protein